jgi:GTPase SAR1 family protein
MSFANVEKWKRTFIKKSMVDRPENFPFLIIGNKIDLDGEDRVVSTTELA